MPDFIVVISSLVSIISSLTSYLVETELDCEASEYPLSLLMRYYK